MRIIIMDNDRGLIFFSFKKSIFFFVYTSKATLPVPLSLVQWCDCCRHHLYHFFVLHQACDWHLKRHHTVIVADIYHYRHQRYCRRHHNQRHYQYYQKQHHRYCHRLMMTCCLWKFSHETVINNQKKNVYVCVIFLWLTFWLTCCFSKGIHHRHHSHLFGWSVVQIVPLVYTSCCVVMYVSAQSKNFLTNGLP